jgi:polar amino acid transport system substrate-binding protein
MKNRLVTLTALALFGLGLSPAWAAGALDQIKKNGLRVCMEPVYLPFEMTDKRGQIIGFDPDLAALMAKELGAPKLELVSTAWDDLIPSLLADKCDIIMSGMTITEERSQKIDFSNAYLAIGQTVLLRKDLADKVKTHQDLNDPKYKVVTRPDTTSEKAAREHLPKATHISAKIEPEGVAEVVNGKADAFIGDSPYNLVANIQLGQGKLVFLDSPFTLERIGWGIRKGDPEFLGSINDFLQKIARNGSKHQLYQKWFKNTDWLKDIQQ